MLYEVIGAAATPPTLYDLPAMLPEGKFDTKRISLLLEVMLSRKAVVKIGDGANRTYALPQ